MANMKTLMAVVMAVVIALGAVPALAEDAPEGGAVDAVTDWFNQAAASAENLVKATGELEVRGQSIQMVAPDTVSVTIGVSVEDASERVAQEQANTVINSVIASLREMGVEDSRMVTSGYNVTRRTDAGRLLSPTGYVARISLRVTVNDFDLINAILDTAVENGANEVEGISFSYSQQDVVYQEALRAAIGVARQKAEVMAQAAGVELRTLLAIREGGFSVPMRNAFVPTEAMMDGGMAGTEIMSGEIEIAADVTLVFQTK